MTPWNLEVHSLEGFDFHLAELESLIDIPNTNDIDRFCHNKLPLRFAQAWGMAHGVIRYKPLNTPCLFSLYSMLYAPCSFLN